MSSRDAVTVAIEWWFGPRRANTPIDLNDLDLIVVVAIREDNFELAIVINVDTTQRPSGLPIVSYPSRAIRADEDDPVARIDRRNSGCAVTVEICGRPDFDAVFRAKVVGAPYRLFTLVVVDHILAIPLGNDDVVIVTVSIKITHSTDAVNARVAIEDCVCLVSRYFVSTEPTVVVSK